MLLHTQWYGTFILNKMGDGWLVADFKGAEKDAEKIALELNAIADGEILDRERELSAIEITHVSEERLKELFPDAEMVEIWDFEVPHAHEKGYPMTLILEANTLKASMKKEEGPKDGNIMSAVGALTDIDSSLNLVKERITEWYTKHWPKLDVELMDDPVFLRVLSSSPYPGDLKEVIRTEHPEMLERMTFPDTDKEVDLTGISTLASLAQSLLSSRKDMESYIEGEMGMVAPNLSKVVVPLIGARLIHSAGGLMRLARLPSSTVQVLGAEKMFFKFLKEGGKPPKHGVLFQHPWVHSLPGNKRGKMARSLASKASLASKMDAYGGGDSSELKEKIELRAKEIREMEVSRRSGGGRQPPFREGWWADKGKPRDFRKRGKKKRK